jgi:exonuclease SbcC
MIQIKQLYIENFKGIEEGFTIDFTSGDTKVNILSGPNGFGKTTIFEAIEFCLTNRFGRKEIFAKTQDSRATPNKAHFHNDFERDVVLKLWLTRGDDSLIIVKTHEKRQRKESFTTYTTSDSDYFINDDYSQLEISTQQQIDDWVYDSNISLTNTFDLGCTKE